MRSQRPDERPDDVTQRIVILGGGPAGYEAGLVAAELGADVTIVADEGLGGNSVLWDCVPSKALIVAAEAMGWLHTANGLGVHVAGVPAEHEAPADRTIVDFPALSRIRRRGSQEPPRSDPGLAAPRPTPIGGLGEGPDPPDSPGR